MLIPIQTTYGFFWLNRWKYRLARCQRHTSRTPEGIPIKLRSFALIRDFEADGRIEEFIRVVVDNNTNSPFISPIKKEFASDEPTIRSFSRRAYQQIDRLWGNKENKNKERWGDIFRLAFADHENPDRFREQFTKMISVQHNDEAARAYEEELRKKKAYLKANQVQIYQSLEKYLDQQNWKKADYETAFIMYQWMVIENYDDFDDLFRGVSLDVINEIGRLWMQYSKQQFGIKGQAKIYRDLGGTEDYNYEIWKRFGDRVGWLDELLWLDWELDKGLAYRTTETHNYHLPLLMYCRFRCVWWMRVGAREEGVWGCISSLAPRLQGP